VRGADGVAALGVVARDVARRDVAGRYEADEPDTPEREPLLEAELHRFTQTGVAVAVMFAAGLGVEVPV
jgi:hypothetical protein